MGIRGTVGLTLESVIGHTRTERIRTLERRTRNALAKALAMEPPKKRPIDKPTVTPAPKPQAKPERAGPARWQPNDPFVFYPTPPMTRHEFLKGLHERTRPRTYLEIGVQTGASMGLSRTRTIGVDPDFRVTKPIQCDVQLVRDTSDNFFAGDNPLDHFDGVPVDLAFIDGMHLSEFALRDFMNIEPLLADTGVVVLDDVLPRNGLEAARDRKTGDWTGDVYKVVETLRRRRSDLVVLLVNTDPTGTAVVLGVDQASTILGDAYEEELNYLVQPDPQTPPHEYLDRSIAVDPDVLLGSAVWGQLVTRRESGATADLGDLWNQLRKLQLG